MEPSLNKLIFETGRSLHCLCFKGTLKAFDHFKNKQTSVWSNGFWYVKVCIFWKCFQYTIYWDKTHRFKKCPSDKINGAKNALFFLSRAPTHHSFIFDLWFLHQLKHKVRLSKIVCGIFDFQFRFVLLNFIFLFKKCMDSLTLKRNNSFQNLIIEKPHTVLLPLPWILKLGSHRGDKLHRPSSSPEINVVVLIKGSLSNLHRRDE